MCMKFDISNDLSAIDILESTKILITGIVLCIVNTAFQIPVFSTKINFWYYNNGIILKSIIPEIIPKIIPVTILVLGIASEG